MKFNAKMNNQLTIWRGLGSYVPIVLNAEGLRYACILTCSDFGKAGRICQCVSSLKVTPG